MGKRSDNWGAQDTTAKTSQEEGISVEQKCTLSHPSYGLEQLEYIYRNNQ